MTLVQQFTKLRRERRTSARVLAERSGIHTPNIYAIEHGRRDPSTATFERLIDAEGLRALLVDTDGVPLVSETAEQLKRSVDADDSESAYRHLIQISDDLVNASASTALLLAYTAPDLIDEGWDAAIAGVAEWRLVQKKLPLPDWLTAPGRSSSASWEPFPTTYRINRDDVPEPLRRRNVLIEQNELESA